MNITLNDKYSKKSKRVFVSGVQALVRLMLVMKWIDTKNGLLTAGFVSGYRGSPLGGLDKAFMNAKNVLDSNDIKFIPGVNEDLAATSIWGTQQLNLFDQSKYHGVFSLWYGKSPGVDRCGDVFKHMSFSGTSRYGGVLLVAGDDHGAYSSTLPNQSDHLFAASMIPFFYPSSIDEYTELGVHAFNMSRISGLPIGFKALADTVESSSNISANFDNIQIKFPGENFFPKDYSLNATLSSKTLSHVAKDQEDLMHNYKIYNAIEYVRINNLNRIITNPKDARIGIIASGKSYLDVVEALGMFQDKVRDQIRLMKVVVPWPLEPSILKEFATGLKEIIVVEEKRQLIEYQIKEHLYHYSENFRPRIIGKYEEKGEWELPRGNWLLPILSDFSANQVYRVIEKRLLANNILNKNQVLDSIKNSDISDKNPIKNLSRPAWYCSGCPHNSSTKVPENSIALAGIGCHVMATAIYPKHNKTVTHMGGEGATWIGQSQFSNLNHVFVNLGDGTYFHSGSLAIRAAIAAKINITYKILFNNAVAMTGGQQVDGELDVENLIKQLVAEGIRKIILVTENYELFKNLKFHTIDFDVLKKEALDIAQTKLRNYEGVSVLVYDQICAAEKRRKINRGQIKKSNKMLFISPEICEGCGDCGVQSNCTSLYPLKTNEGVKRVIDQTSCNNDESCIKGFCPSFISISGKKKIVRNPLNIDTELFSKLKEPKFINTYSRDYNVLIVGIGGTGVITLSAIIGMASHIENKKISVLDMTGMSQKNGSVSSHLRFFTDHNNIGSQRIPDGHLDLLLSYDLLGISDKNIANKINHNRTNIVVNSNQQPTGHFAQDETKFIEMESFKTLSKNLTKNKINFLDTTSIAEKLTGNTMASNLFMLGFSVQKSLLPIQPDSILKAIELNGVQVKMNSLAFNWGRIYAEFPEEVHSQIQFRVNNDNLPEKEKVESRYQKLITYHNQKYAEKYKTEINKFKPSLNKNEIEYLSASLYKIMAFKDEYEVARLLSSKNLLSTIEEKLESGFSYEFNISPNFLRFFNKKNYKKISISSNFKFIFTILSKLKFLRFSFFDPFKNSPDRKLEKYLFNHYLTIVDFLVSNYDKYSEQDRTFILSYPQEIKGFGHVKLQKAKHTFNKLKNILEINKNENLGKIGNQINFLYKLCN